MNKIEERIVQWTKIALALIFLIMVGISVFFLGTISSNIKSIKEDVSVIRVNVWLLAQ